MKITKKLFNYLDSFDFVDDMEINSAILDFFCWDWPCFYSDCARASDIVDYYNEYKKLKSEWMKIDWNILKTL